jgi:alcohol dehydrogenase, propanol-preferring
MRAMVLSGICDLKTNRNPLKLIDLPVPVPQEGEVLVRVSTCGVCHTELDEIEGRTPPPAFPIIPGHQVVGIVERIGAGTTRFSPGDRVGIAWIHSACGECRFCREGNENLCERFMATGRDAHGGYAEYTTVPERFAYPIPEVFSDLEAAPLLCAGTIGYRSLRLTGIRNGQNLGLIGFGASAHLVLQMARYHYPESKIFVFARSAGERSFAKELGAFWTGETEEAAPEKVQVAIDTTPIWKTILEGLRNLDRGGRLVINAIRKEETDKASLLALDYPAHLWLEKEIKSVANVTRQDVEEFLRLAARIPIKPETEVFSLEDANRALVELKERKIRGAKVLTVWR